MTERFKLYYKEVLSAGIIAILLIVPLLPKIPLVAVSRTFVAVRTEDFLIGAFSLLTLPLLWRRRKELLQDKLVLAILGFLVIGLLSTFSSIFVTQSVYPHLAILHYLRRIEYLAPFFIVYALMPSRDRLERYLKVIIFTSAIVLVYGLGQIYLEFPVFSTANVEYAKGIPLSLGPGARINSTFAGHYDLAAYTALILSIIGAFVFGKSFGERQKQVKILLFLIGLGNLWLLLQTASRVSFIAYLVGGGVVLLLLKKRLFLILFLIFSLLTLLSSGELRNRFLNTLKYGTKTLNYQIVPRPVLAARMVATPSAKISTKSATEAPKAFTDIAPGEPTDTQKLGVFRSSRVRFDFEWPKAWGAFLRNPIFGSGYSSLGIATDNDYLRSLGEVGFFGTAAFALIFVEIFRRIYDFLKKAKEDSVGKSLVVGICGATVAFLINATFIDVFEASKVAILFWTFLGIFAVTVKTTK